MPKSSPKPKEPMPAAGAHRRWASDVIVDLLHRYQLPYAAMNPGASYRGLHDSIVNYGGNKPYMMLCQHEETAVQIAHGYAKASGKPMVAIRSAARAITVKPRPNVAKRAVRRQDVMVWSTTPYSVPHRTRPRSATPWRG